MGVDLMKSVLHISVSGTTYILKDAENNGIGAEITSYYGYQDGVRIFLRFFA